MVKVLSRNGSVQFTRAHVERFSLLCFALCFMLSLCCVHSCNKKVNLLPIRKPIKFSSTNFIVENSWLVNSLSSKSCDIRSQKNSIVQFQLSYIAGPSS